ncbi:MAG: hypothetical protein C4320_01050 [Armatimonadota bacterium]
MPTAKALIVWGGWDGHVPDQVAALFEEILRNAEFEVTVHQGVEAFTKADELNAGDLFIPITTMVAELPEPSWLAVQTAVRDRGVGVAGCHGGMCDAFRQHTEWQFLTGSQWVAHPGGDNVPYTVEISDANHPITTGLPSRFEVSSEQYYLHVDAAVYVLATTHFPNPAADGPHVANVGEMPQVYTKMYGRGRVFYNALGHTRAVLEAEVPRELMRRGFLWAANRL